MGHILKCIKASSLNINHRKYCRVSIFCFTKGSPHRRQATRIQKWPLYCDKFQHEKWYRICLPLCSNVIYGLLNTRHLCAKCHPPSSPLSSDNCISRLWFSFLIDTVQLHWNWRLIQIPNSLDPSLSLFRSFQALLPITQTLLFKLPKSSWWSALSHQNFIFRAGLDSALWIF